MKSNGKVLVGLATVLVVLWSGNAWALRSVVQPSYDYFLRGLLFEEEGRLTKAYQEYEKAVKLEPASADLHKTIAGLAFRMGRLEEAANEAGKALSLAPSDLDTHLLAGQIYFAKGDAVGAQNQLESALKIDPQSEEALLNLAAVVSVKNPRKALAYYEQYVTFHPGSGRAYEHMALIDQAMGNREEAERNWKRALEAAPESGKAQVLLGQLYEIKKDTATALEYYEKARRSGPPNLSLLLHMGQLYYQLNRSTEAASVFLEAENLSPENPTPHFWLALLSEDQKNWPEALRHMERVTRVLPEPGTLLRLSYYQAQAGDAKSSVKTLEKLQRLDPHNPDTIYYLALGYEQSGKLRQATRWFKKYLDLKQGDAFAHFELATILDRLGRFQEAVPHLLTAIELKPDYDTALNYLGYSWADRKMNLKDAEVLIQRALQVEPTNGAYLDSLGWVYYQEGRFEEAQAQLARAAHLMQDVLISEHWGAALWSLGQKEKALEVWERAEDTGLGDFSLRRRIKRAQKEVPFVEQARLALRRARLSWQDLKNFSSLAKVVYCRGVEKSRFLVQMHYRRSEFLRVEPLSPGLSGFLMLEGNRWVNGLVDSPLMDAALKEAIVKIDHILSGAFLGALMKDPHLSIHELKERAEFRSDGLRLAIETDSAQVTDVEWIAPGESQGTPALSLRRYRRHGAVLFPNELSYRDSQSDLTVKIVFYDSSF